MKLRVLVLPRKDLLDPQGEAVCRALRALGLEEVVSVRVGKCIELELPDQDGQWKGKLEAVCREFLANPVVEEYQLQGPLEEPSS